MKKKILALAMSGIFAGGIFIQDATLKVEAGIFSNITDKITGKKTGIDAIDKAKDNVIQQTKDTVKDAVNKALAINVDGMHDHKKDMEVHLKMSAAYLGVAADLAYAAAGMSSDSNAKNIALVAKNLQNGGSFQNLYTFAGIPISKELSTKLEDKMKSFKTEAEEKDMLKLMKMSKDNRTRAMVGQALALRDATFIVRESAKGLSNLSKVESIDGAKNFMNKLEGDLKQMSDIAGDAQKLCGDISKKNKALNDATKLYDKKNNIKEDKELKKNMELQLKAKK